MVSCAGEEKLEKKLLTSQEIILVCVHLPDASCCQNTADLISRAAWDVSSIPEAIDADLVELGGRCVAVQPLPGVHDHLAGGQLCQRVLGLGSWFGGSVLLRRGGRGGLSGGSLGLGLCLGGLLLGLARLCWCCKQSYGFHFGYKY